jgi:uncharacterized phage protein gp47/JayE
MATVQEFVDNIIAQLQASDPNISAAIGTPERKIIEAAAEQMAQSSVDIEVLSNQHDVDALTGNTLDSFLSNFGFGRQQPTRATGVVTFSRLTTATSDIIIPRATQVVARQSNLGFAAIVFVTTETVVLATGQTSADAHIEATIPGSIANLPAGSINAFGGAQPVTGISSVSNALPTSGGIDGETDAELRVRFKNTLFRNVSGTTDQALANAVSMPSVSKANVVGPISHYQEYIQAPDLIDDDSTQRRDIIDPTGFIFPNKMTTAPSTIPYSKFTYDSNFWLSNGDLGSDEIFFKPNVHFVFNNPPYGAGDSVNIAGVAAQNHQPNVTILSPDLSAADPLNISPGSILLLEHAYMSRNSRNDFLAGILNCVDVFIDGINAIPVQSLETMPGNGYDFGEASSGNLSYRFNFKRALDGSTPTNGNRLQTLYWQPAIDLPDQITVGDNIYRKAKYVTYNPDGTPAAYYADADLTQPAHYWLVIDDTELYGTVRARNGIEWSSTVPGIALDVTPSSPGVPVVATSWTGTQFTIDNYSFDQNISDLQAVMEQNKQTTTDVLVHQANVRYFQLYITVMYAAGVNIEIVNSDMVDQLNSFFAGQYFGTVIQMSDLLQVIHNTPGVDNVRWSSEFDSTVPRVAEIQASGAPIIVNDPVSGLPTPLVFNADFFLQDNELPALPPILGTDVSVALVIRKRAQNTWVKP